MKKILIATILFFGFITTLYGQGISYNPYKNRNYIQDSIRYRNDGWKIRNAQHYNYSYGIGDRRLQFNQYNRYGLRTFDYENRRFTVTQPLSTSLDIPFRRNYKGYRVEIYVPGRR